MGKIRALVGAQWGDEGKGKVTDFLASKADVVVRSQGGNNAGHTIKFKGKTFALHLVPSGIFHPQIRNYMTNGMVINPIALTKELQKLDEIGVDTKNLFISDRAHVVMPYHVQLDEMYEEIKGPTAKIGTTKSGIGPAYMDKASRDGIRMADLLEPAKLRAKIETNLTLKNTLFSAFGKEKMTASQILEELAPSIERLAPYLTDTSVLLNREIEEKREILFEGAQGSMLCLDHGSYPYVTSSSPTASSIPLNAGIAPRYIQEVIGIAKAYTTRVGEGAFPTELLDDQERIANFLRTAGNEFGTTTGRPRRIGYLDTVILNHAKRISGITEWSIMLLDVLSGVESLKICTSYQLNGESLKEVPSSIEAFQNSSAEYIELTPWSEDITGVKNYDDLPLEAKTYIQKIEELTQIPVTLISVGPDREQTIVRVP